ncbi:DNA-3-methyladenine glycosylase I [Falsihalocynthiibacter sp. S25ZX9]|uniref:DNA-3-methyladenine glycosylase I n=1 Tax=unclassified Falsihalocynthiibacter TaxID=2854191 RepID=UPI00350FD103
MQERCGWVGQEDIYIAYHDTEWGVPVYDSRALWEKLVLDGFQAGLSWITILKKRQNFIEAFHGFDPNVIATWGEPEIETLLQNPGIIRHRGKIAATISNARVWQAIEQEQGFDTYLWNFVDGKPLQNNFKLLADVPPSTPLSTEISKDLKKRGFKFCGPTIVYAFMEAVGMANDHIVTCPRHSHLSETR